MMLARTSAHTGRRQLRAGNYRARTARATAQLTRHTSRSSVVTTGQDKHSALFFKTGSTRHLIPMTAHIVDGIRRPRSIEQKVGRTISTTIALAVATTAATRGCCGLHRGTSGLAAAHAGWSAVAPSHSHRLHGAVVCVAAGAVVVVEGMVGVVEVGGEGEGFGVEGGHAAAMGVRRGVRVREERLGGGRGLR